MISTLGRCALYSFALCVANVYCDKYHTGDLLWWGIWAVLTMLLWTDNK